MRMWIWTRLIKEKKKKKKKKKDPKLGRSVSASEWSSKNQKAVSCVPVIDQLFRRETLSPLFLLRTDDPSNTYERRKREREEGEKGEGRRRDTSIVIIIQVYIMYSKSNCDLFLKLSTLYHTVFASTADVCIVVTYPIPNTAK